MEKGVIYIIPDENKIMEDCFVQKMNKDHLDVIYSFVKKYKLEYGDLINDYQLAPCLIANDGHLLIKTEDDYESVVCYIPKVVTDRQNVWFHTMFLELNNYKYIRGFKEEEGNKFLKIDGMNKVLKEIDRRNLMSKREENVNVRKKI